MTEYNNPQRIPTTGENEIYIQIAETQSDSKYGLIPGEPRIILTLKESLGKWDKIIHASLSPDDALMLSDILDARAAELKELTNN